jgi:cation diffusion facilitator family transporter
MKTQGEKATIIGIAANSFLFVIKITVGLMFNSLAVISDAVNSFSDIIYSGAIYMAVKISAKKADKDHPFGHHRAEPVAALIVAILAGILGFQIVRAGIEGLFVLGVHIFSLWSVLVLLVCMSTKIGMWLYFRKIGRRINSPALLASSIDSRNDVLISFTALIGVFGAFVGYVRLDDIAAILIGLFIIWSGYKIGMENIDFLMGKSPSERTLGEVKKRALSIEGVLGLNDVRAHYVGSFIHVEVHIELDERMDTKRAHDIGKAVQRKIEEMRNVDKAFIHIDPK